MKSVAIIESKAHGMRLYEAKDKTGRIVWQTAVPDCGHGASIAYRLLRESGFKPSKLSRIGGGP